MFPPSRASDRLDVEVIAGLGLEDVKVGDDRGRSCPPPPERPGWSLWPCPVGTTVCGAEREELGVEIVGVEVEEGHEEVVVVEVEFEDLDNAAVFDMVSSCVACFFFFFFF